MLGKAFLARRWQHAFSHEALADEVQASATLESAEEAEHLLGGDGAGVVATNPVTCFTPVTTPPPPKELSMYVPRPTTGVVFPTFSMAGNKSGPVENPSVGHAPRRKRPVRSDRMPPPPPPPSPAGDRCRSWDFHTARAGIDTGVNCVRLRFVRVLDLCIEF